MDFSTPSFLALLGTAVLAHRFAAESRNPAALQNLVLLVSSLIFLGRIDHWFPANLMFPMLAVGMGLLHHYLALVLARSERGRGVLLAAAISVHAAVLCGLSMWWYAAGWAFVCTLRSLAWLFELYRNRGPSPDRLLDTLAWLLFFPLSYGLIVRPSDLSLQRERFATFEQLLSGLARLAWGAVRVQVISRRIALQIDPVFCEPTSWVLLYVGAICFSVQLFASLSGWIDAGRGAAQMFGFVLPPNFDRPFLARHPLDFWRRWHTSLSSWFDDYVCMPLTPRLGPFMAMLASFLLLGLWYDMGRLCVVFGLWHGLWAAADLHCARRFPGFVLPRPLAIAATFLAVVVPGWMTLRMDNSLQDSCSVEAAVWQGLPLLGSPQEALLLLGATAPFALLLWLGSVVQRSAAHRIARGPVWLVLLACTAVACAVTVWAFRPVPPPQWVHITF